MAEPGRTGSESPVWRVEQGDCIDLMAALPEDSVDAVVCDPPYGLGFMGKDWDSPGGLGDFPMRRTNAANTVNTGATRQGSRQRSGEDWHKRQLRDARTYQAWCERWGVEALRVLKPGGYLLAFGGTRTYHRLVCGLEDAGFEVRDMVEWLYGSGFPKHPSCLKPAHEPIVLARKAARYSVPLQIDACRLEPGDGGTRDGEASAERTYNGIGGDQKFTMKPGPRGGSADGRWPANVLLDPEAAAMLDAQSGTLTSGEGNVRCASGADREGNRSAAFGAESRPAGSLMVSYGDQGGASRFFYVAKPDTAERNVGLDQRNPHPTVKPVELMRWLCRLVTPKGGTVLDPFAGSGTTGIAAMREGFSFIGFEQDADYVNVARARIVGDAPLINGALEEAA